MSKTIFTPSRNFLMTCFMLVLIVFSTTIRFVGVEINTIENNFISLDNQTEIDFSLGNISSGTKKNLSKSDSKQEKEPLTLKTAHSSDALLQGIVTTELFQNIILTPSIEFSCISFSSQTINSISYYFSSSSFFKTLFRCFISPNAP
ncbi:hypothetical protein Fleli_2915 [Bernardetia litoralis DSM 6794]|uniref:Uncharacterized protein n=1 Tax=Bernardetia litoralis (strain ATCC 23117 / DSM 6794 / NBRC 15988 / NCIMB 1366 / Fx l1 / Sio-4) TaxID=880071 RepID=I4AMS9_BERLS|nr:hypothetical protein [Bernardetia litoralis]AFM05264.1 hypothetical protein Fleli_2915 [Bernardetia litoralis DSM 6794]